MDFNPEESIEFIIGYMSIYGLQVMAAFLIFFAGKWVVGLGVNWAEKIMLRAKLDVTLISFLKNVLKALGLALVIIATLSQVGVETTSLAAVIAAAGLAVGLALQGSLSNLAAGMMIIIFRPIRVGDYIEAANTAGTVRDINIFTTALNTPDNKRVIVPNSQIVNGNITNYSTNPTRRIDMVFGIGYDDDIKKAKKILTKIVTSDERVLTDPAPQVVVSELGESSINFNVRPWVKRADFWPVRFDVTEKVKLEFDKAGISIPFPQRDVHFMMDDETVKQMKKIGFSGQNDNKKATATKKAAAKKKSTTGKK